MPRLLGTRDSVPCCQVISKRKLQRALPDLIIQYMKRKTAPHSLHLDMKAMVFPCLGSVLQVVSASGVRLFGMRKLHCSLLTSLLSGNRRVPNSTLHNVGRVGS
jgi:hypothetical protein